jgi:hypothetical protein
MRPYDHPLRTVLHEEVHARPPVALWPRDRILNQAFLLKGTDRQQQLDWINAISEQTKQPIDPNHGQTFRIIELRPAPQRIIIKWELHGEFSSISTIVQQTDLIIEAPIKTRPALENEVNELLSKLSIKPMHEAGGLRISAIDIAFEDRNLFSAADEVAHLFSGNTLIGSTILTNQKAQMWTDLSIKMATFLIWCLTPGWAHVKLDESHVELLRLKFTAWPPCWHFRWQKVYRILCAMLKQSYQNYQKKFLWLKVKRAWPLTKMASSWNAFPP